MENALPPKARVLAAYARGFALRSVVATVSGVAREDVERWRARDATFRAQLEEVRRQVEVTRKDVGIPLGRNRTPFALLVLVRADAALRASGKPGVLRRPRRMPRATRRQAVEGRIAAALAAGCGRAAAAARAGVSLTFLKRRLAASSGFRRYVETLEASAFRRIQRDGDPCQLSELERLRFAERVLDDVELVGRVKTTRRNQMQRVL